MVHTRFLRDLNVVRYTGLPLVKMKLNDKLCGGDCCEVQSKAVSGLMHRSHQKSRSSVVHKNNVKFDNTMGFVTTNTLCSALPVNVPVHISDPAAYLHLASAVKDSGVPNYMGMRVPLPSTFDLEYIKQEICGYHAQKLLEYLTFGFPLGLDPKVLIASNANDNHASAVQHAEAIDEYIAVEKEQGALLGPFKCKPHAEFTWSPLMTRPKGSGRRVILDLSFGEYSVNKATLKGVYEDKEFTLKLPRLDDLIPTLTALGQDARLMKVDISRAFRHVKIDLHLGIYWQDEFYLDQNLAFGAVNGTAIFERITDLVRFIMAKKGYTVYNYIDDIYACCHKNEAQSLFDSLIEVLQSIDLRINPSKVHPPQSRLSIMGIVVDVKSQTFGIESEKLNEILGQCLLAFTSSVITRRDLQSLLGKLLYVAQCVRGAHIFLNRILQVYRNKL